MSAETWLAEFYPVAADKVPVEQALQHSLVKWKGLRPEALAKHEITKPPIDIDAGSCALCEHHCDCDGEVSCQTCPLYLTRGETCDCPVGDEFLAPYQMYSLEHNPEPMIDLLEEVLEKQNDLPAVPASS